MYPASTPLVPDDQYAAHDFGPRDLDAERDLRVQRVRRPLRQGAIKRASIGSRIARSVIRFVAAILIGVGLTLAWQSHADDLTEIVTNWAPSLASLLPSQAPKKSAEPTIAPEMAQQIKLMAIDLAIVRRNVGQLAANQDQFAAKQEQMNQNLAVMQQVEQEARQQALSPPASKVVHPPAHGPVQTSPR
jgi:hypothetical protein